MLMSVFQFDAARVGRTSDGGQIPVTSMDKAAGKIKYGFQTKSLYRATE
jgi:hypothetical protein